MYSDTITAQFLDLQRQQDPSFRAEYHSIADVDAMTELLGEAYDTEANRYTRRLAADELWWIENERLLCTHDFRYWSTRYAWINNWHKELARFTFNVPQEVVLSLWSEMEAKRWAILMIQLKARQLGVSTLTELAVAHRAQFWPDVDAVIASSTPSKTEKLAKMTRTCWAKQPWWLMPDVTRNNAGYVEFGGHNSAVDMGQSGNQFSGVSRGSTPNIFHGSELCEWGNPKEDIDASLLNAIHETPFVFVILESTALGRDNWWHDKWRASKEGWPKGRARLCPIFLPWFTGTDIYPDDSWLRKHPVPFGWQPEDQLLKYAKRAEAYVRSHATIRQFLGQSWVMPKEQLWWYEVSRDEARKTNILNKFLQECPMDDFEAFQSSNYSAFRVEVIQALRAEVREPIGVYRLQGLGAAKEDIPVDHRPTFTEVDSSQPPVPIHCRWGTHELDYQLIPVKFEGYDQSADGRIFIYEWPEDGFEYGVGVDTGDGLGLDGSVCQLLRKGDLSRNDAQVAEMTSPYINAMSFWPWAYALGSLYSAKIQGSRHQARASIDCLRNGEIVQLEMRKRGWANFHQWMKYDNKRLRLDRANKIGFFSNNWARTMMLEMLLTYINNGWLDIRSPMFISEMESLEKDEEKQSARAAFGGHDDRIMALGHILFSFHVLEMRGPKISVAEQRQVLSSEDDPVYDAGWQGRDYGIDAVPPTLESLMQRGWYEDR